MYFYVGSIYKYLLEASQMEKSGEDACTFEGRPLDSPSKLTHSKVLDTKTFLVTISVPGDLNDELIKKVCAWVRKQTTNAYVVTEHGASDRLHLHALMVFKESRLSAKIRENLFTRFVKPYHPDAIGRVAVVVTVQYDHKWYDEYLRKEKTSTTHVDTYDRETVTSYFPTLAVQEALQTKREISRSGDRVMSEHLLRWTADTSAAVTPEGALIYFKKRMFVDRDMIIIVDKRKLCQKAYALYELRVGQTTPCVLETRYLNEFDSVMNYQ